MTVIVNALSEVFPPAVALNVKLSVAEPETSSGSPEIAPVELLSDKPPNEPDCKE